MLGLAVGDLVRYEAAENSNTCNIGIVIGLRKWTETKFEFDVYWFDIKEKTISYSEIDIGSVVKKLS